ncbi:ATP-binding protein [Arthrobacter crystallopoietes]|uniref:ATP-binding protein n=1 Tax=Crystallibacter crystallopoietes TaxID=37928 RepID=UPI001F110098|nr:ATP-binding protein [Arthrobacter crystallopoietes]
MTPHPTPFRPTAGAEPPRLVGRAELLDEFEYGLRICSGTPGLLTIFTGARGVGKTVMLGESRGRSPPSRLGCYFRDSHTRLPGPDR